jgi:predicted transposase YdaD
MVLGIRGIEESSVYQDIFAKGEAHGRAKAEARGRAEGRVNQARDNVLLVGRKKFGQPDQNARQRIDAINDLVQLESLLENILDVSTWDELLDSQAGSA